MGASPMTKTVRSGIALVALVAPLLLLGCRTTHGARTIRPARVHYSEALSRSWNEHLLLNLVRLRYRDTVQFVTVGEIVTQYSFSGNSSLGLSLDLDGDNDAATGAGVSYSESPTISYTPLHGEEFVRRMLAPMPPESIMLLANSGWSIERLLMCCVYRVNSLENSRAAAGPTPDYPPVFGDFRLLSRVLRELQKSELLRLSLEESRLKLFLLDSDNPASARRLEEARRLLGVQDVEGGLNIVSSYVAGAEDQVAVVGRSLLAVLFYLSQGVKPPAEHEQERLVTVTPDADGQPLDWWNAMTNILRIQSASERPESAFVSIPYRGYWFYVDDRDLHSKSTFQLLTFLFNMQAASGPGAGPLLTLNAGG